MKLTRFKVDGRETTGIVEGSEIYEVHNSVFPGKDALDLLGFLESQNDFNLKNSCRLFKLEDVELLSPIKNPEKILAIGLNYESHRREIDSQAPSHQIWFNKQVGSLSNPFAPILKPDGVSSLDYEGELAFIIKKDAFRISKKDAKSYIAGYLIANDVSVREWQFLAPTWTMGKSFPSHCPVGPWLITPDDFDFERAKLKTYVNGQLRQEAAVSDMIFKPEEMLEFLSQRCVLKRGDIILTGTPSGSGMSFKPNKFLAVNDIVKIEINSIGELTNKVKDFSGF